MEETMLVKEIKKNTFSILCESSQDYARVWNLQKNSTVYDVDLTVVKLLTFESGQYDFFGVVTPLGTVLYLALNKSCDVVDILNEVCVDMTETKENIKCYINVSNVISAEKELDLDWQRWNSLYCCLQLHKVALSETLLEEYSDRFTVLDYFGIDEQLSNNLMNVIELEGFKPLHLQTTCPVICMVEDKELVLKTMNKLNQHLSVYNVIRDKNTELEAYSPGVLAITSYPGGGKTVSTKAILQDIENVIKNELKLTVNINPLIMLEPELEAAYNRDKIIDYFHICLRSPLKIPMVIDSLRWIPGFIKSAALPGGVPRFIFEFVTMADIFAKIKGCDIILNVSCDEHGNEDVYFERLKGACEAVIFIDVNNGTFKATFRRGTRLDVNSKDVSLLEGNFSNIVRQTQKLPASEKLIEIFKSL